MRGRNSCRLVGCGNDSTAADAYNQLGMTSDEMGKDKVAIEDYTHALILDPELHDVHYNLGVTCFRMGRLRESREEF